MHRKDIFMESDDSNEIYWYHKYNTKMYFDNLINIAIKNIISTQSALTFK